MQPYVFVYPQGGNAANPGTLQAADPNLAVGLCTIARGSRAQGAVQSRQRANDFLMYVNGPQPLANDQTPEANTQRAYNSIVNGILHGHLIYARAEVGFHTHSTVCTSLGFFICACAVHIVIPTNYNQLQLSTTMQVAHSEVYVCEDLLNGDGNVGRVDGQGAATPPFTDRLQLDFRVPLGLGALNLVQSPALIALHLPLPLPAYVAPEFAMVEVKNFYTVQLCATTGTWIRVRWGRQIHAGSVQLLGYASLSAIYSRDLFVLHLASAPDPMVQADSVDYGHMVLEILGAFRMARGWGWRQFVVITCHGETFVFDPARQY